jgi:formate hydrogenlyase subunit 6/NADH:ubiquinone oxidoreductase subunit I/flavodoxin
LCYSCIKVENNKVSTEVYYFSGTGNSLSVAKDIAQIIHGTLVPMASAMNKRHAATDDDQIGLVFPAYMAQLNGIPLIVKRFIRGVEDISSKYIFAVCTCGGYGDFNGLPTLRNLAKLVRHLGGRVSAEYSIRLPMNTLDYSHIPVPIDQDQDRMFKNCDHKIQEICQTVARRAKSKYKLIKVLLNWAMTPMYLMLRTVYFKELRKNAKEPTDSALRYYELIPLTDKSIYADDKCKSCSTCAKVCPVGNIVMVHAKPTWQHRCEICLACAEWCPNKAIHHSSRTEGKTYRHPRVKLDDMLEQANR